MIWQENIELIVMVAQLREDGRAKCAPYWPGSKGESATYGDFRVTNTGVQGDDPYDPCINTTTMKLERKSTGGPMLLSLLCPLVVVSTTLFGHDVAVSRGFIAVGLLRLSWCTCVLVPIEIPSHCWVVYG